MNKDFSDKFYYQVKTLLNILPAVSEVDSFALKGGTAINLFFRDMPRLSVDIDLIYLPLLNREQSLLGIERDLITIKDYLNSKGNKFKITEIRTKAGNNLIKLNVEQDGNPVIIEPNTILRGTVYPPKMLDLCEKAESLFETTVLEVPVASLADVYAGKMCAALDRQHPRDLFDIKVLFEHEGLTEEIRRAFIVYLASSSRPMHELLEPNQLDQRQLFENEFIGMSRQVVKYDELHETRSKLIKQIRHDLTDSERQFLVSVKKGLPDWSLLPFEHLSTLPALQWKIKNINKMDRNKHKTMLKKLTDIIC